LAEDKGKALGFMEDMPLTIKVQGQDVVVTEESVYLGCLIHSTTGSSCDISHRSAITSDGDAMQSLEHQIWRSRLATSTQLKLYNTCMVRTAGRYQRQAHVGSMHSTSRVCICCLQVLGIKWYQFVRNDDVRRLTKQPKLTAIIQSR